MMVAFVIFISFGFVLLQTSFPLEGTTLPPGVYVIKESSGMITLSVTDSNYLVVVSEFSREGGMMYRKEIIEYGKDKKVDKIILETSIPFKGKPITKILGRKKDYLGNVSEFRKAERVLWFAITRAKIQNSEIKSK